MRITTILVGYLLGCVLAAKLPDCAGRCITKSVKKTGCSSSNSHCICSNEKFMKSVKSCAKTCGKKEGSIVFFAEDFCSKVEKSPSTGKDYGNQWNGPGHDEAGHNAPEQSRPEQNGPEHHGPEHGSEHGPERNGPGWGGHGNDRPGWGEHGNDRPEHDGWGNGWQGHDRPGHDRHGHKGPGGHHDRPPQMPDNPWWHEPETPTHTVFEPWRPHHLPTPTHTIIDYPPWHHKPQHTQHPQHTPYPHHTQHEPAPSMTVY